MEQIRLARDVFISFSVAFAYLLTFKPPPIGVEMAMGESASPGCLFAKRREAARTRTSGFQRKPAPS